MSQPFQNGHDRPQDFRRASGPFPNSWRPPPHSPRERHLPNASSQGSRQSHFQHDFKPRDGYRSHSPPWNPSHPPSPGDHVDEFGRIQKRMIYESPGPRIPAMWDRDPPPLPNMWHPPVAGTSTWRPPSPPRQIVPRRQPPTRQVSRFIRGNIFRPVYPGDSPQPSRSRSRSPNFSRSKSRGRSHSRSPRRLRSRSPPLGRSRSRSPRRRFSDCYRPAEHSPDSWHRLSQFRAEPMAAARGRLSPPFRHRNFRERQIPNDVRYRSGGPLGYSRPGPSSPTLAPNNRHANGSGTSSLPHQDIGSDSQPDSRASSVSLPRRSRIERSASLASSRAVSDQVTPLAHREFPKSSNREQPQQASHINSLPPRPLVSQLPRPSSLPSRPATRNSYHPPRTSRSPDPVVKREDSPVPLEMPSTPQRKSFHNEPSDHTDARTQRSISNSLSSSGSSRSRGKSFATPLSTSISPSRRGRRQRRTPTPHSTDSSLRSSPRSPAPALPVLNAESPSAKRGSPKEIPSMGPTVGKKSVQGSPRLGAILTSSLSSGSAPHPPTPPDSGLVSHSPVSGDKSAAILSQGAAPEDDPSTIPGFGTAHSRMWDPISPFRQAAAPLDQQDRQGESPMHLSSSEQLIINQDEEIVGDAGSPEDMQLSPIQEQSTVDPAIIINDDILPIVQSRQDEGKTAVVGNIARDQFLPSELDHARKTTGSYLEEFPSSETAPLLHEDANGVVLGLTNGLGLDLGSRLPIPHSATLASGDTNTNLLDVDKDLSCPPLSPWNPPTSLEDALRQRLAANYQTLTTIRQDNISSVYSENRKLEPLPISRYRTSCGELVKDMVEEPIIQKQERHQELRTILSARFSHTEQAMKEKIETLRDQYKTLHQEWVANCRKLDEALRTASVAAAASSSANGSEPVITSSGRVSRRNQTRGGDTVQTEWDMEQAMAKIANEDLTDPNVLALRNIARIPDMITLDARALHRTFNDTNGLVDDPSFFYDLHPSLEHWTTDERTIFVQQYAINPKQFGVIASFLPDKTPAQCVAFYYLQKKTLNFRAIVAKFGTRKRRRGRGAGKGRGNALLADIRKQKGTTEEDEDWPEEPPEVTDQTLAHFEIAVPPRRRRRVQAESSPAHAPEREETITVPQQQPSRPDSPTGSEPPTSRPKRGSRRRLAPQPDLSETDITPAPTPTPAISKRTAITRQAAFDEESNASEPRKTRRRKPPADKDKDEAEVQPRRKPATSSYWSVADKAEFKRLVGEYGRNYKRISQGLSNKTPTQVANYFKSNVEKLGLEKLADEAESRQMGHGAQSSRKNKSSTSSPHQNGTRSTSPSPPTASGLKEPSVKLETENPLIPASKGGMDIRSLLNTGEPDNRLTGQEHGHAHPSNPPTSSGFGSLPFQFKSSHPPSTTNSWIAPNPSETAPCIFDWDPYLSPQPALPHPSESHRRDSSATIVSSTGP